MSGEQIYLNKDDAQGRGGGFAKDFGVHKVAQADEGTGEGRDYGYAVEHPPDIELALTAINPDGQ